MEVRKTSTERSATVTDGDGRKLFSIELPPQVLIYDVKKNEGKWYQVDFLLVPEETATDASTVKGSTSISSFCEVECDVSELNAKSSKYLSDDATLSVREPLKGFDDSTVTLFYRNGHPWIHLKFLGLDFRETSWTPGMFDPLKDLAEAYQRERHDFEAEMQAKVDRVGKSDD